MADFGTVIPERYRIAYDSKKDCWYVLDTHHPQIRNVSDFSQDIPDDHPAVKIITGTEMNALIQFMKDNKYFDKIIKTDIKNNIIDMDTSKKVENNKYNIKRYKSEGRLVKALNSLIRVIEEENK